jgi:hypothetical protein
MLGAAGAPQLLLEKQAPLREVTLDPGEDPTKHQRLRVQGRRDAVRFAFGEIEYGFDPAPAIRRWTLDHPQ